MFAIYEKISDTDHLGFMLNEETGDKMLFATYEEAEAYAKENCAWRYAILEL